MNYALILEELGRASLFELYRLNSAIGNQLDDPTRIAAVKLALTVGQTLRWFDRDENRLVEAKLLRINRTRAEVQNIADGKPWTIPFYLIDLEGQDVAIAARKRQALDHQPEGWRSRGLQGPPRPKTVWPGRQAQHQVASVRVGPGRWRVGCSLLAPVIDGVVGFAMDALPGQWSGLPELDLSMSRITTPADWLIPLWRYL
ncbi:MAG: hypothetical protein IPN92_11740 [Chromatiaceae bacterium]|nr:hypothetical protein [Chromatiaceae bacterium]